MMSEEGRSEETLNLWHVCFDHTPQQIWSMRDKIDSRLLEYGPDLPFTNCSDEEWMFTCHGLVLAYARVLEDVDDPILRAEGYDYLDRCQVLDVTDIDWPGRNFLCDYYTYTIVNKYQLYANLLTDVILFPVLRNLVNVKYKSKLDLIEEYRLKGHRKIRFLTLVSSPEEVFTEITGLNMFNVPLTSTYGSNGSYVSSIIFTAAEVSRLMVEAVIKALMSKNCSPQYLMNLVIIEGESSCGSDVMEWSDYYKGPNSNHSYWKGPVVGVIGSPHSVKMIIEALTEVGASFDVSKPNLGLLLYPDNVDYVEWVLNNDDNV